jgi:hypothetical protein
MNMMLRRTLSARRRTALNATDGTMNSINTTAARFSGVSLSQDWSSSGRLWHTRSTGLASERFRLDVARIAKLKPDFVCRAAAAVANGGHIAITFGRGVHKGLVLMTAEGFAIRKRS